jgi:hypothetical protein
MRKTAFETAVQITSTIYTHAVIHCIAESIDGNWQNLYTSVIFGREIDLLSVPDEIEHREYDQSKVCLRVRLSRENGERLLSEAKGGLAQYGAWDVRYRLVDYVEGFRPGGPINDIVEQSFWEQSLWVREGIGSPKIFGTSELNRSNAWTLSEYLPFLKEARWSPIPLARHPEKLGDLDEIYPSPFAIETGNDNGTSTLQIATIDNNLDSHDIVTMGTLMQNDLIVRSLYLEGRGPLRFDEDFNGMNMLTTVNGIPMDAQAHWFMRSFAISVTSYGPDELHIPAEGSRKELNLSIPHRDPAPRSILGDPSRDRTRHKAWIAGRVFRRQSQPADAERFYDPRRNPDASAQALLDLQLYGNGEEIGEIVVADPYALDERAMRALAVMSLRKDHVPQIDILTHFDSGEDEDAPCNASGDDDTRAAASDRRKRDETRDKAKVAAQKVATALKVKLVFYKIESLHDRFLVVGERLWHIGCSFNQLGQKRSAVVEMRDDRVKRSVFDLFDSVRKHAPEFEVVP